MSSMSNSPPPFNPLQNRLLAALPESARARLLSHLELVPMPFRNLDLPRFGGHRSMQLTPQKRPS
jgi:hypothetical protein